MRAFRVVGKYPIYDDGGNITHTDISITTTAGMPCDYTERVLGNHVNKSDEELVELCRNEHFKSEYSDRAMAESVQKIDELEQSIKANQKLQKELQEQIDFAGSKMAQVDNALERLEKESQKIETLIKTTTGTVNELIANMMGGMEDEEITE